MPDLKRNLRILLEYDGTRYQGWQKQKHTQDTIQQVLEAALQKLFKQKIAVYSSGRTDAGVHALNQTANFIVSTKIPNKRILLGVNAFLPKDIVVKKVTDAPSSFHSRFSCRYKTYRYAIVNRHYHAALARHYSYLYPWKLDLEFMRKESKALIGRHDFRSFCSSNTLKQNCVRTIKKIAITKDKDKVYIDVQADGFLYNMVRSIVGTLLLAGRGKLKRGRLLEILKSKDRKKAGPVVPAKGLCLIREQY
ncbi:MAG: tRNA pseudouridine(38-40) synthase TruA [Candidatus Omnitrophica bacterium]|jgi:tRNA pseudouridine38-40 synthase|nr:tRNA pseudouridine(38-40) synthase TruA [Candidatus Omnitrophota bacterium]